MALFLATVMKWQTGKPQNWKRVRDTTNGTAYVLNTNRMDSWRLKGSSITTSSLYYFDRLTRRDSGSYMEVVKTPTELIAYCDTSQHGHITLPVYPDNDTSVATVNHTILTKNFSYAVVHEVTSTISWVTYCDNGWETKTVLVNLTLADIIALL